MDGHAALTPETERSKPASERLPSALPSDSPSRVLALIERVALEPRADVEKLEQLMAMYERLQAKEAELAHNAAKGRILKKLVGIKIVKNRSVLCEVGKGRAQKGCSGAFSYAPLEEIDKHLRPLLAEEEMDLSYSNQPTGGRRYPDPRPSEAPAERPLRRFFYAGPAGHLGWQVERAGSGEHELIPSPIRLVQHI
jgi:hypothetical protein